MVVRTHALALLAWLLAQAITTVEGQTVTGINPTVLAASRSASTGITLTGSTTGDTGDFAVTGNCPTTPLYAVDGSNAVSVPGAGTFTVTISQAGWTGVPASSAAGTYFGFTASDADTMFGSTLWATDGGTYTVTQSVSIAKTAVVKLWRNNADCNNGPCGRWDTGSAGADWALNDVISYAGPMASAGDYAVCYKAAAGAVAEQTGGHKITVTLSTPFAFSAISATTANTGAPTTFILTSVGHAATGDKVEFSATGCSGDLSSSGTASALTALTSSHSITVTLSSAGTYNLCYVRGSASYTDSVLQLLSGSYTTIIVTVSAGVAGTDPIARFGDTTREFELPLQQLVPLLKAPDIAISGSVFAGNPSEQWFNRIILASPDNERWMEIKIKEGLETYNASKAPVSAFWTLDVAIADTRAGFISNVPGHGSPVPLQLLGYELSFRKMHRHNSIRFASIGRMPRECLDMAGPSLHIYICSAPADEYYGEFHHLSLRYAHLDLTVVEIRNTDELTGVLPELWGIHPMSEQTRSYVTKETVAKTAGNSSTLPSVGGYGQSFADVKKDCLEPSENDIAILTI